MDIRLRNAAEYFKDYKRCRVIQWLVFLIRHLIDINLTIWSKRKRRQKVEILLYVDYVNIRTHSSISKSSQEGIPRRCSKQLIEFYLQMSYLNQNKILVPLVKLNQHESCEFAGNLWVKFNLTNVRIISL